VRVDNAVESKNLLQIDDALNARHLKAYHAVVFSTTRGATFLVVDANGEAGYQAGEDLLIKVEDGHLLSDLSTGNFLH
jgi:hypothetical protein